MEVNFTGGINLNTKGENKTKRKFFKEENDTVEIKSKREKKKEPFIKRFKTFFAALGASILTSIGFLAYFSKKLTAANEENKKLENENNKLNKQLENIALPENADEKLNDELKKLASSELNYDPIKQTDKKDKEKRESKNNNPVTILPETYTKTTNRSDAKALKYPKFKKGEPYEFKFPESDEIKITKEQYTFKPIERTHTNISENYADSLKWDNDKIARDLLQNFFDGHNQTLDGVKFSVIPQDRGKYKVRLEGKSVYSPDKAILLGESSKKNNENAAGNYGEGLKMVVLKLLKEKGANSVNISSGDWRVNWNLDENGLNKRVLSYQLDKVPEKDGNYMEFETTDTDFIESIIKSFDRFYHYNNPAFKCPDFENDTLAIKLKNKNEKGNIFIAGQAFEADGEYGNIKGMDILIKKRPPQQHEYKFIFDPSRDRTSLNSDNMSALGEWVASKKNMSKDDVVKLIHSLEEFWDLGTTEAMFKHSGRGTAFISGIFKGAADRGDLNIKFPDKCIADYFFATSELKDMYIKSGYRLCSSSFKYMGMPSVKDVINESREHKPLEPTESEKNKILILKEALMLFEDVLCSDDLFDKDELDTKIFIYDRNSKDENQAYKNVSGEAITEEGKSLGFWMDKELIDGGDFSKAFATSLHELTHKFGGDESQIFSYKLTDIMEKVFLAININPNLAIKLKILEKAWNEQNKE